MLLCLYMAQVNYVGSLQYPLDYMSFKPQWFLIDTHFVAVKNRACLITDELCLTQQHGEIINQKLFLLK